MILAFLLSCSQGVTPPEVLSASPLVEEARARAQARMREERARHSIATLQDVEELYQVANEHWGEVAAVAALEKLVRDYPGFNRTGCALLYLGQMSEDQQQLDYLGLALSDYPDSYYGDGVQVGPYAAWQLAAAHHERGEHEQERRYLEVLTPADIDHRGRPLLEQVDFGHD